MQRLKIFFNISTMACCRAAIPGEKPRHPERSEGSPKSGSVPYLEDHCVQHDVISIT